MTEIVHKAYREDAERARADGDKVRTLCGLTRSPRPADFQPDPSKHRVCRTCARIAAKQQPKQYRIHFDGQPYIVRFEMKEWRS